MQLSASVTSPADPSLASLLAGGDTSTTSALPSTPVGEFAQLFPGLAPASAAQPPVPPTAAVAPTTTLAPALRAFTPVAPLAAADVPPEAPAGPSTAPAKRPAAPGAAKPSRPVAGPAPKSATPASASAANATPVVALAPENLLLTPPAPVATEFLASPQPTEEPADELLAEHPPHEESAAEEEPVALTPSSAAATTAAPAFAAVAPHLTPVVAAPSVVSTEPVASAVAPASTPTTSPLSSSRPRAATASPALPRAEFASRQFSAPSAAVAPDAAPVAAPSAVPASAPDTVSSFASVESTPTADLASSLPMETPLFRPFRPEFRAPLSPETPPVPSAAHSAPVTTSTGIARPSVVAAAPFTAAPVAAVYAAAHLAETAPATPKASVDRAPEFSLPVPSWIESMENTAVLAPANSTSASAAAPSAIADAARPTDSAAAALAASTPGAATVSLPKAKFAARVDKKSVELGAPISAANKSFLNADVEKLGAPDADVGTDVAKSVSLMPTASFHDRSASAAVPPHASFAPVARVTETEFTAAASASVEQPSAPTEVASAHRAVEAVLVAADRFSAGERHSVNLQFSVGGADLNVRVELRADEVRATFRTDSPELRDALSHEWQAAHASSSERSFRFAPPVITSSNGDTSSSAFSFTGGDASSRQRDTSAQHAEQNAFASLATSARAALGSAPAAPVATAAIASAPLPAARRGAHRLLAHA